MSKTVVCPVEHFSGMVTLSEPMTLTQVIGFEKAMLDAQSSELASEFDAAVLPGLLACVEKFELSHMTKTVTAETFPGSPRQASQQLIKWLLEQVSAIYRGETEIPNA